MHTVCCHGWLHRREGQKFQAGPNGIGYYRDVLPEVLPPPPPPPSPLEVVEGLFSRAVRILSAQEKPEAEPSTVLGVLCVIKGDYEGAIKYMQQALELEPTDYQLWNKLGAVQTHSSQKNQAADSYRKALALRPGYRRAVENLKRLQGSAAESN